MIFSYHVIEWRTGITTQQAEILNLTCKSTGDLQSKAETLKSDSN